MEIQINTNEKTIAVEQDVKIDEFLKAIRKLFPNNEWKEYTLKTETIIKWTNPIIYERWDYPYYPWYTPTTEPWTICTTGEHDDINLRHDNATETSGGVHCVEVN